MDLVASSNRVIVTMEHCSKGNPKLVQKCLLPLTGHHCVDMCVTEKAVFKWDKETREMRLLEVAEGLTPQDIEEITESNFKVSEDVK